MCLTGQHHGVSSGSQLDKVSSHSPCANMVTFGSKKTRYKTSSLQTKGWRHGGLMLGLKLLFNVVISESNHVKFVQRFARWESAESHTIIAFKDGLP